MKTVSQSQSRPNQVLSAVTKPTNVMKLPENRTLTTENVIKSINGVNNFTVGQQAYLFVGSKEKVEKTKPYQDSTAVRVRDSRTLDAASILNVFLSAVYVNDSKLSDVRVDSNVHLLRVSNQPTI